MADWYERAVQKKVNDAYRKTSIDLMVEKKQRSNRSSIDSFDVDSFSKLDDFYKKARNFGFYLGKAGFDKKDNYYDSLEYRNLLMQIDEKNREDLDKYIDIGIDGGNRRRNSLIDDTYGEFYNKGYEDAKIRGEKLSFTIERDNVNVDEAQESYSLGYKDYFKDYYYYQGMKQAFDGINADDTNYDKEYDVAFWIGYFQVKDLAESEFDSNYYNKGLNGDIVSEEEKKIPSYILGCKVVEMDNFFGSKGKKK